jgi:hypothetical protein
VVLDLKNNYKDLSLNLRPKSPSTKMDGDLSPLVFSEPMMPKKMRTGNYKKPKLIGSKGNSWLRSNSFESLIEASELNEDEDIQEFKPRTEPHSSKWHTKDENP